MTLDTKDTNLKIAYPSDTYSAVTLVDPTEFGYIHLAAEVDRRHPFLPMSWNKKALVKECKQMCQTLAQRNDVQGAIVFKAL